jgi:hypothetical protein
MFVQFNLYNWLFTPQYSYGIMSHRNPLSSAMCCVAFSVMASEEEDSVPKNESCILKLAQYHFNTIEHSDSKEKVMCEHCPTR